MRVVLLSLINTVLAAQCPARFHIYNGTSCTQRAFKWTNETSADDCCATCSKTPGCNGWEWCNKEEEQCKKETKPGNCHLKSKAGPHTYRAGFTCGDPALITTTTPHYPAPAPMPKKDMPNIVWFLTDDQDQKLGGSFPMHNGVGPMPKTKIALADKGATASNWFIHTPICCPSRSELVTGRYFHNLKTTGGGCMHIDEDKVNNQTYARYLRDAGYTVGMFGKYLNNNPSEPPIGIDAYMTNGGGTYYSPSFDTRGVSDLAPYFMKDGSWHGNATDYTTSIVGNVSISWIKKVAQGPRPFMAYIAPKACHEPFSPATWYENYWDPSWPKQEPRPETWNCSAESRSHHHGNIATQPMISEQCADYVTTSFKNRWRSLMSVDDLIHSVVTLVEDLGVADKTYFMYSSDHGFQLGEFNILIDKRQMYDQDIRIHLLARGPGIKPMSTFPFLGTQVDIAPTWLGLAGLSKPSGMDGRSIVPLIVDPNHHSVPRSTYEHIVGLVGPHDDGNRTRFKANWRDSIFIEYYFNSDNTKCKDYPTEDIHNNFIGIRHLADSEFGDTSYTEYQTGNQANANIEFDPQDVDFVEYFNITADNWQWHNLWINGSRDEQQKKLHDKLHMWFNCQGDSCP